MFGLFKKGKKSGTKISSIRTPLKSKSKKSTYKVKCNLVLNEQQTRVIEIMTVASSRAEAIKKVKKEVEFKVEKAYKIKGL